MGRQPKDPRRKWPERMRRIEKLKARIDVTGMTRPFRDPEERAFLERTGQGLGPFREVPIPTPTGLPPWILKHSLDDEPGREEPSG